MNKILVILGPTAVGKTKLALSLSKKFKGEIVSFDSRQLYRDMDIATGKDIPKGSRLKIINGYPCYIFSKGKIWGYDLAYPNEEYSVAQFVDFADGTVSYIQKNQKLPILTGGTGFYLDAFLYGIETIDVPRNVNLRKRLNQIDISELFENLAKLDPVKAGSLNSSDKKNPRRLVRAIEVATWKLDHKKNFKKERKNYDVLIIGLCSSKDELFSRIEKRLLEKISPVKKEIKNLLKNNVGWEAQSMTSLGYRQWRDYFKGEKKEEETVRDWLLAEKKYALRQMTWFKKEKDVVWFDITKKGYLKKIENMVKKWYICGK